jgi:hypothetical protein
VAFDVKAVSLKQRAVEQINGAKAETATLLLTLLIKIWHACCPFPPRSSQSFGGFTHLVQCT